MVFASLAISILVVQSIILIEAKPAVPILIENVLSGANKPHEFNEDVLSNTPPKEHEMIEDVLFPGQTVCTDGFKKIVIDDQTPYSIHINQDIMDKDHSKLNERDVLFGSGKSVDINENDKIEIWGVPKSTTKFITVDVKGEVLKVKFLYTDSEDTARSKDRKGNEVEDGYVQYTSDKVTEGVEHIKIIIKAPKYPVKVKNLRVVLCKPVS